MATSFWRGPEPGQEVWLGFCMRTNSTNALVAGVARRSFLADFLCPGLAFYYLSSLIAVLGVVVGQHYVPLASQARSKKSDVAAAFSRWDAVWYVRILEHGYDYDPRLPSCVAFFPAYPVLGRAVSEVTGLRPELALLLVSHVSLAAAFVVFVSYV